MTNARDAEQSSVKVMHSIALATRGFDACVPQHDQCFAAYRQEFDYVCRTLRRLGVHPDDVEDVLHDFFLVLYRKWGDYDASRPLRPYLFGIAYRVAIGHFRRNRHRLRAADANEVELEDGRPRPDQALAAEQDRALVLRAIERVPLERRAVMVMHDIDDVPMRDIASVMSIPLFTAYSRLRKGRKEFEAAVQRLRKGSDLR